METALTPGDFIASLCADTDAVWEIDLATLQTVIWHDTTTPELVTMAGMLTDTAENGKITVGKMAAAPDGYYDLIFMDMQMPVMDGCEASRQIRNLDRADAGTVPIVAMTANAFAEDIEKTRQAGMNEHVAKPIDYNRLEPVLARWLKE